MQLIVMQMISCSSCQMHNCCTTKDDCNIASSITDIVRKNRCLLLVYYLVLMPVLIVV